MTVVIIFQIFFLSNSIVYRKDNILFVKCAIVQIMFFPKMFLQQLNFVTTRPLCYFKTCFKFVLVEQ